MISLLALPLSVTDGAAQDEALWPEGNDKLSKAWRAAFTDCSAAGYRPMAAAPDTSAVMCVRPSEDVGNRVYLRTVMLKGNDNFRTGDIADLIVDGKCGEEELIFRQLTTRTAAGDVKNREETYSTTYVEPGTMLYAVYRAACPR